MLAVRRLGYCLLLLGVFWILMDSVRHTAYARPGVSAMQISSSSFAAESTIPKKYTCDDAADASPHLSWSGAPQATAAYAIIADDPDAPAGTWTHWLIWNIPASKHELAEGVAKDAQLPDGSRQGRNDFGKVGYSGPCPPPGKPHRYYFRVFALNAILPVNPGVPREQVESAVREHTIAQGEFMARYGR